MKMYTAFFFVLGQQYLATFKAIDKQITEVSSLTNMDSQIEYRPDMIDDCLHELLTILQNAEWHEECSVSKELDIDTFDFNWN